MKTQNFLFYTIFLLFAFYLNGFLQEDTTYETEGTNSDEDVKVQQDEVMQESEDVHVDVPPPKAFFPLNKWYTTNDFRRLPQYKGNAGFVGFTTGPRNASFGAYEFHGRSNSFIEFPNIGGILDTKHSITMLCWVRPGGTDGPLFNYLRTGPWGVHLWIVNGKLFCRITVRGSHSFRNAIWTNDRLEVGKWVHVAATYDHRTGINALYVDGVLKKTLNIGMGYNISTDDPSVRMGVKIGDGRYFRGAITQMGIFDVALTEKQILAVRNVTNKGFNVNPCDGKPCNNGGNCTQLGHHRFKCTCAKGFTGKTCAQDTDECAHEKGGCQDLCVNTVGGYHCACSDPELSLAPDHRHCIAEGVELDCGQNDMTITLPKSLLLGIDREHLRLIDENCRAFENATHFFLRTQLKGCQTILRHRGDYVIYGNMVSEIPLRPNQIVTRVRDVMIPFYCFYSKWGVVSSIGIRPVSKKVILSSKGFGRFTLNLDLFRTPNFSNPYSQDDFPVEFTIRERMFFEVSVDTEDSRLSILALNCFATPSQSRSATPRYDIITDGCKRDDTLEFHPSPNDQSQRFSLEAFQYVRNFTFVFFHCTVKICDANDPNSRCEQGCRERKRRSEKALADNANDEYPLAQGPLTLEREKREVESDETVKSNQSMRVAKTGIQTTFMVALAVVVGVCVMGMSYMAYQKKRGPAARQYKPLFINEQN